MLVADEPTTALDVTIQAQLLDLLHRIQDERRMGLLLITHDMGVVAQNADEITVMYAGRVVEQGSADDVFGRPEHPYTRALLRSVPRRGHPRPAAHGDPGAPPDLGRARRRAARSTAVHPGRARVHVARRLVEVAPEHLARIAA